MKTKKSKRANLENKRTLFIQIGFVIVLILVLAAFEWKSTVVFVPHDWTTQGSEVIELDMPITKPQEEKIEIKPITPIEKLIIENNKVEIIDEPEFLSTEDSPDSPITVFEKTEEPEIETDYVAVEIKPKFMGQEAKYFRNYIAENIIFPREASENGMGGKVYVSFVIGKDGYVQKVDILRGVNYVIDQAVIDVIKNSPKWEPGVQSGHYVNVRYNIVVNFEIAN